MELWSNPGRSGPTGLLRPFLPADVLSCLLQDGTEPVVKDVVPGDSVHSLLSILDIITVSSSFIHVFICPDVTVVLSDTRGCDIPITALSSG